MSGTPSNPWWHAKANTSLPTGWVPPITAIENIEIRFPALDIVEENEKFRRYYSRPDRARNDWEYVWIRWMERNAERAGIVPDRSSWADPVLPDDWRPSFEEWVTLAAAFKELDLDEVHEDFHRRF